jgi:hypothetical protein
MTLPEALISVWQQVLTEGKPVVRLGEKSYSVGKTRSRKLRTVEFLFGPHEIVGLEQNPQTQSRWAALARQGKRIMQFSCQGRYIGNVVEGRLNRYGAWKDLRLPG